MSRMLPSLGPFAVKRVDSESIGLQITGPSQGRYKVDVTAEPFLSLSDDAAKIFTQLSNVMLKAEGGMSPSARITLDEHGKEMASIPATAVYFCFANPLDGLADIEGIDELNLEEPFMSFVCLGGFIYFDENFSLVGANALYEGPGLYFEGPLPFEKPAVRSKLDEAGRLTPPTIAAISAYGVTGFCWLPPGEPFEELGEDGHNWAHGAFLYVYDNPDFDCYFHVTSAPADAKLQRANTTVRAHKMRKSGMAWPDLALHDVVSFSGKHQYNATMRDMGDDLQYARRNTTRWEIFVAVAAVLNGVVLFGCQILCIYAWPQTSEPAALDALDVEKQVLKTNYPWYAAHGPSPTSWFDDRSFLRLATIVLWVTVVVTGIGMELVVGEPLVAYMGDNAATMQVWKASQLFFSLSISVALFSQSPFGFPFAVIGFWCPLSGRPSMCTCCACALHLMCVHAHPLMCTACMRARTQEVWLS